jgi:hypothetical protein
MRREFARILVALSAASTVIAQQPARQPRLRLFAWEIPVLLRLS